MCSRKRTFPPAHASGRRPPVRCSGERPAPPSRRRRRGCVVDNGSRTDEGKPVAVQQRNAANGTTAAPVVRIEEVGAVLDRGALKPDRRGATGESGLAWVSTGRPLGHESPPAERCVSNPRSPTRSGHGHGRDRARLTSMVQVRRRARAGTAAFVTLSGRRGQRRSWVTSDPSLGRTRSAGTDRQRQKLLVAVTGAGHTHGDSGLFTRPSRRHRSAASWRGSWPAGPVPPSTRCRWRTGWCGTEIPCRRRRQRRAGGCRRH